MRGRRSVCRAKFRVMDENVSPTAYGDTWYAATKVEAPERPKLNVGLDVDVCVIGGGLAGLTTAREVARGGWSVVLVEASRLAANASGRNTGFVLPGFRVRRPSHTSKLPSLGPASHRFR